MMRAVKGVVIAMLLMVAIAAIGAAQEQGEGMIPMALAGLSLAIVGWIVA